MKRLVEIARRLKAPPLALTLAISIAYCWKTEGNAFSAAVIFTVSLAAFCFERYLLRSRISETETIKADLKALQDRVGRSELSLGLKQKF